MRNPSSEAGMGILVVGELISSGQVGQKALIWLEAEEVKRLYELIKILEAAKA